MDEIWDLIESVSEGFPSYSFICLERKFREMFYFVITVILTVYMDILPTLQYDLQNVNRLRSCLYVNVLKLLQ